MWELPKPCSGCGLCAGSRGTRQNSRGFAERFSVISYCLLPPLQKHTEEITKLRNDFERQVRGQCLTSCVPSGQKVTPRQGLPSRGW